MLDNITFHLRKVLEFTFMSSHSLTNLLTIFIMNGGITTTTTIIIRRSSDVTNKTIENFNLRSFSLEPVVAPNYYTILCYVKSRTRFTMTCLSVLICSQLLFVFFSLSLSLSLSYSSRFLNRTYLGRYISYSQLYLFILSNSMSRFYLSF